ncbi:MAG: hypothetical protein V1886_01345 [archaeon]
MAGKKKTAKKFFRNYNIIKIISLCLIVLAVSLSSYLSISIALKYGVIGDDFRFHIQAAEIYASGDNAMSSPELLNKFGGPYPPLFHLFLALFIKTGILNLATSIMQALFYPLILLSAGFLVFRKKGVIAAAFTILLMFGSIALFDRAQVIPQSIDMILFPLAVLAFLSSRKIPFIALMLVMIYSHGYFSILLLLAAALYSLAEKKNRSFILLTGILSLPLAAIFIKYIPSYLALRTEANILVSDPLFFVSYLGLNILALLPLAIAYFILERKSLDELDKFSLWWLLAECILLWKFPDRFASYAVVPASIIISKMLTRFSRISSAAGIFLAAELFISAFLINFMKWFNILKGIGAERFNIA